ncbi:DNA-binding XRE family transcriptional regulator [Anaerospora hongkongensis]|uniref:DNA-binding XRE family transcriptional regulator n=1 Tax=Anaerospora hongkongensis TaxID=244830 RepID=A0A4V2Q938_9FIRM|nr:helix-turn-helix transcriptional regulator [Anaerospora hongkongensis]TCL40033.1 DNA-binding XRE family transcriptional regulator [Anaerospora hongkongensis]
MKIKRLRVEKGWSQQRLANEAGVPRSSLADLETRKTLPSHKDQLERIAKALGVSIDDLYD